MQLSSPRSLHQCRTPYCQWSFCHRLSGQLLFRSLRPNAGRSPRRSAGMSQLKSATRFQRRSAGRLRSMLKWISMGGFMSWWKGYDMPFRCTLFKKNGIFSSRLTQVPHQKCWDEPREHCTQKTVICWNQWTPFILRGYLFSSMISSPGASPEENLCPCSKESKVRDA